jgi:predicted transcriptional regulator
MIAPMTARSTPERQHVVSDEERAAKRAAIARGRADIAAGRVISNEAMNAWLDSWGTDNELPPPKCE